MVQELFWYSAYALGALGAISFGYLAIRFSYPDARAFPSSAKLGFSLLLGLIFFVPSILLSLLWVREAFFAGFPIAAFFTALAFEMKVLLLPSKTMSVALPVITVNPEAAFAAEAPTAQVPQPSTGEEEISRAAKSILKAKKLAAAVPASRYCGNCGSEMSGGDVFCGNCGAKM